MEADTAFPVGSIDEYILVHSHSLPDWTMEQHPYAYRFDWGLDGLRALAPIGGRGHHCRYVAVHLGGLRGVGRWGHRAAARFHDEAAADYACGRTTRSSPDVAKTALVAVATDLLSIRPGTRIVLPSPNGSALAFEAQRLGARRVLAGSLRNASVTANYARTVAGNGAIAVIAAGERWQGHVGPVRFSG